MRRKIFSILMILVLCICSFSASFADDSTYSIISPQTNPDGIVYCDNLLVSVKVSEDSTLRFTLYSYPNYSSVASISEVPAVAFTLKEQVGIPEVFQTEGNINFYTKQISDIEPGLYSLKVDILDENSNTVSSYSKYFIAKPTASKLVNNSVYESQPSSKVLFFQSVFKSLFGSSTVDISE